MSHLAERLMQGVAALREANPAGAVEALTEVVEDSELAAHADLQDIRARACSLHADALLSLGRVDEADRWCRESIRILRRLRDEAGLREVRAVQDRIVKAMVEAREQARRDSERARIAATSIEDLLDGVSDPAERSDIFAKKSGALIDEGRLDEAVPYAEEAVRLSLGVDAATTEVMARITLARARRDDARAELVRAWERAEAADEFNLVSLVARAAEVIEVELPRLEGPAMPRRSDS